MTQKEIAQYCDCSQDTISQIKNRYGKKDNSQVSVSYEIGAALKKLHTEKCVKIV
ncbi:helix-turn-helix domain-containing protein [Neisseriaceae bacterium B1]